MEYGPGRSYHLWEKYFTHPDTQLSYIEHDGECVKKMNIKPRNGHVFVGSQDNITFLEETANRLIDIGGLDVLVDDGGHRGSQQIASFHLLWKAIRPGGLYVVEDVHFGYTQEYGGTTDVHQRNEHTTQMPTTFMGLVVELLDVLNCDVSGEKCDITLQSVQCYHHICAMRKAWPEKDFVDLGDTSGKYEYPAVALSLGTYNRV